MPNIASASKRLRQSLKNRIRNRSAITRARSSMKTATQAVAAKSADSETALRQAISALDRAAQKRVIHPNTAARKKSRLMRKGNAK